MSVVNQIHREAALRVFHPVERLKPKDGVGLDVVKHKKAILVLLKGLPVRLLRGHIWRATLVCPAMKR